jgi:hypothetical protein
MQDLRVIKMDPGYLTALPFWHACSYRSGGLRRPECVS